MQDGGVRLTGAPEPAFDRVRVAAPLDGVTLKEAERRIGYRLLTLDEIRETVEAWMGSDLKMLAPVVSPSLYIENLKIAAAVALVGRHLYGLEGLSAGATAAAAPWLAARDLGR